jgi:hypothetical protein
VVLTVNKTSEREKPFMKKADAAIPTAPAAAPENPPAGVAGFAWAGIIVAAGGSLTFNIWHDYHAVNLPLVLAVIAGSIPPFLSAVLAHVAVTLNCGLPGKAVVFAVTGGAMVVSAFASSQVLAPGYGIGMGVVYSLVMDAAAMTCLYFLFRAYEARAAHSRWLAGREAGTAAADGNHAGGAEAGNQPGEAAGSAVLVPGTAVVPGGPVPVTGSGNDGDAAAGNRGEAGAPSARPGAVAARSSGQSRAPRTRSAPEEGAGESREAVVEEIAARPRPTLESTAQQQRRALEVLAEFRRRTGCRMSNQELARALGVRKAAVVGENGIRRAIQDREEAAA